MGRVGSASADTSSILQTTLSALKADFDVMLICPAIKGVDEDKSRAALVTVSSAGGVLAGQDGGDWEASVRGWLK
jgi:hypothetical protein